MSVLSKIACLFFSHQTILHTNSAVSAVVDPTPCLAPSCLFVRPPSPTEAQHAESQPTCHAVLQIMLIAHTVNTYGSQLAVIGNTGSNSTREALHATEQGFAVGMDAALQINPYYGKTSTAGMLMHFHAVVSVVLITSTLLSIISITQMGILSHGFSELNETVTECA